MIQDGANKEDIVGYLNDIYLADKITRDQIADEILAHKPYQGYLARSNAKGYGCFVNMDHNGEGIEILSPVKSTSIY
jgi:hypothetical protein